MRFAKASEPIKGSHRDTMVVRFAGKIRVIENRHGEYWVWQTDQQKEIRVYDNQWGELEYLDESLPASIEDEAERLYPIPDNVTGQMLTYFQIETKLQRSAHITAARQYMGEIEQLKAENSKMRKALEEIAQKYADAEVLDDIGQFVFEMGELATSALK